MIFYGTEVIKRINYSCGFAYLKETSDLSQLTMRKLAKVLSVQAPALYWYFTEQTRAVASDG